MIWKKLLLAQILDEFVIRHPIGMGFCIDSSNPQMMKISRVYLYLGGGNQGSRFLLIKVVQKSFECPPKSLIQMKESLSNVFELYIHVSLWFLKFTLMNGWYFSRLVICLVH